MSLPSSACFLLQVSRGRSVSGPCPVVRYPLVTLADATFTAVLPRWRSCRRCVSSAVPVRPLAAASPRPPTCSRFLPDGEQALRRGRCHDRGPFRDRQTGRTLSISRTNSDLRDFRGPSTQRARKAVRSELL